MMKKLFLILLRKYSKTEKDRIEILKEMDDGIYHSYYEQTTFGNVYNYFIEFVMANPFIKSRIVKNDDISIDTVKKGIDTAYDQAIRYMKIKNDSK